VQQSSLRNCLTSEDASFVQLSAQLIVKQANSVGFLARCFRGLMPSMPKDERLSSELSKSLQDIIVTRIKLSLKIDDLLDSSTFECHSSVILYVQYLFDYDERMAHQVSFLMKLFHARAVRCPCGNRLSSSFIYLPDLQVRASNQNHMRSLEEE